ncbi:MAG TPA: hypothetical protein VH539_20425 [Gemmatimonadaceae bacterium]
MSRSARGVREIAIDLGHAGHLDDRVCRSIRDAFLSVQTDPREGPRAKLVLTNVDDAQLEQLRAHRLTHCIPVERRQQFELTSEVSL